MPDPLGAGLLALGALIFTALNFDLLRRTSQRNYEQAEQGQVTDRYTKAIEQLGADKLDVRIGGIYAIERIARDSVRDHPTVMEVLSAFVREHSPEQWPPLPDDYQPGADPPERTTRPDVRAAVTVIGRRNPERDPRRQRVNLADAFLADVNLSHAYLTDADLSNADLSRADLTRGWLARANLTGAHFADANLTGAHFRGANLSGAHFSGADLRKADLTQTDLTDADLTRADLTRADLSGANLTAADLTNADLGGAVLTEADWTDADLTDAVWPRQAMIPEGWVPTGSGRLRRKAPAAETERKQAE
jgi:hypothetical protein